jgi:hypothetical protein
MGLPFETDHAPGKANLARKWLELLDDLGMENVRLRLAHGGGTPDDAFYSTAPDITVPRGFAEDWLRFRDRRAHAIGQRWRWAIFIPVCVSAVAACVSGLVALVPSLHRLRAALPATHSTMAAAPANPASASPASPSPASASANGWEPIATGDYTVVNGNTYLAEAGPRRDALQRHESPDVVRFHMIPGNAWPDETSDGERTELDGYKQPFEAGKTYWVAYWLYIEPGSAFTSDWIILGQVPGLSGHILKKTIMDWHSDNKKFHSETIRAGQNYQFVEKIIVDPVNGYYGAWFNGKQIIDYKGHFGDAGKKYYYKIGVYRARAPETMTVRYANFKFGTADLSSLIASPDPPPPLLPWP